MKRLRMAVIGVGALGRHHARILSGMPGIDLVAVAEPGPSGAAVAGACSCRLVRDYRELLGEGAPLDAVSIVVPTTLHRQVATDFLTRRIPVLVEKPLAADLEDARAIARLADERQVPLAVGHVERFNPATRVAWQAAGEPNCIKYVAAERLAPFTFRSTDIGVVHDLMIHDVDLILDLVRSPVWGVEAFGLSVMGPHEDTVKARLRFENGCVADLTASRVHPSARRTMQIWSGQGTTSVDFTSREVVRYAPTETLLFGTPPVERARQPQADVEQLRRDVFGKFLSVETLPVDDGDALTAELAHFADCVRTGARPHCGGPEAVAAMEVAGRVLQSVQGHQWDGHPAGATGPRARFTTPRRKAG